MAEAIPQTTTAAAGPSVRAALAAATLVSAVTLSIATFELAMADWPSGFVLLVILPLVALVFCGCALWSATLLLRIRNGGAKFALPFLIYALTLAVLTYAPLQKIALQQNFRLASAEPRTDRGAGRGWRTQAQCRLQQEPDRARRGRAQRFRAAATTSSSMRPTKAPMCCF